MRVRAVVVAAGAHIFSAAHVPAIEASGVDVVGIFDVNTAAAQRVGAARGWPVVAGVEELLSRGADLAVVCAPHPLHAELVTRSLQTGHHVVVEKPVAGRLSEIDAMAESANRTGRRLAVVHQHRFRAEVIEAARLVHGGLLGRIHRAVVTASYPKRSVYYTDTPWRGTWRGEGGGVLLNQGLHDIDLLVHLLGQPVRVTSSLRTVSHPIETEDAADLIAEWAGGATAAVHITSAAALDGNRIEIFGTAGALRLSALGLERRESAGDFDAFAAEPGGHFDAFRVSDWQLVVAHSGGTHTDVYADLIAAIANDRMPAVTAQKARGAVEVIAAAMLADRQGRWVSLPVDANEHDAVLDERIEAARRSKVPV